MACTYVHLTGILALQEAELTFSYKRCARILTLVAVSVLGLALLVRALVAFIEALAVLFLAVVVASLALPRGSAGTGVKHGGKSRGCCATLGTCWILPRRNRKRRLTGRRERNDPQAASPEKRAEWFCRCHRRCGRTCPAPPGYGVASRCRDYGHGPFSDGGSPVSPCDGNHAGFTCGRR